MSGRDKERPTGRRTKTAPCQPDDLSSGAAPLIALLPRIYNRLSGAGLVRSAREFSDVFAGRTPNWYASRRCKGEDFSIHAAVNCLRHVRRLIQGDGELTGAEYQALSDTEKELAAFVDRERLLRTRR